MTPADLTPRAPQRELRWPDALADLQDALASFPASVYVVGGAVRDALLGRPVHDLDVTTPGDPIALGKRAANVLRGAFYVLDAERGVARVLAETLDGPLVIDVARYRSDADDLADDLADRDFTVNAMAVDLRGDTTQLIDPLHGEQDVYDKLLRRTGPNAIAADPVRALRAVRLAAQMGFRIEPHTQGDVRAAAEGLPTTSAERVRDELFKMMALARPAAPLRVLAVLDLLPVALPGLAALVKDVATWTLTLRTVERLHTLHSVFGPARSDAAAAAFELAALVFQFGPYRPDLREHLGHPWPAGRAHAALMSLAALYQRVGTTPDGGHAAEVAARALRLSADEVTWVAGALRAARDYAALPNTSVLTLHRYWWAHRAHGVDGLLLALAAMLAEANLDLVQASWMAQVHRAGATLEAYFQHHNTVVDPPVLVDGHDLMAALSLQPGSLVGQLLTSIREAQVTGDVRTADDALRHARAALGDDPRSPNTR